MKTKDLQQWVSILEEKGNSFVDEYEKLCHEHKLIIDAGCGDAFVNPVDDREINAHCQQLRKSVESELKLYKSTLLVKGLRTPFIETPE